MQSPRTYPDAGSFVIRPADLEELDQLNAIEKEAASIFPIDVLPASLQNIVLPINLLKEGVKNGSLWVASANAEQSSPRIVAYALARLVKNAGHLAQIDVLPEFMRQGIGSALVQTAIRWCSEAGLKELWLTTFEQIPWNAPFYSRFGFKTVTVGEQPLWIKQILKAEREIGLLGRVAMVLKPLADELEARPPVKY